MKHNGVSRALSLLFLCALLCQICAPVFAEGETGDDATIYIDDAGELIAFAENCAYNAWSEGKTVRLNRDIALGGVDFSPIASFGGTFDGNGHTISGLSIRSNVAPAGLFGTVTEKGVVQDLTVEGNVAPGGTGERAGGIAGVNRGMLSGCTFVGTVDGQKSVGGIAGVNETTGTLRRCNMNGGVFGKNMTGGIVGENHGSVSFCMNRAYVNTNTVDPSLSFDKIDLSLSGLGSSLSSPDIYNVSVDSGGVAGFSDGALFGCRNHGSVGYQHIGYNVGGVAGRSSGHVSSCGNEGQVYGRREVGGVVGMAEPYVKLNISESNLEQVRQELNTLSSMIENTVNDAEEGSQVVSDRLSAINRGVETAEDNTRTLVDQVTDYWDGTVTEIDRGFEIVDTSISQLSDITAGLTDSSGSFTGALDRLKDALDELSGNNAPDEISAMARDFSKAMDLLDQSGKQISNGLNSINGSVKPKEGVSEEEWRKNVYGEKGALDNIRTGTADAVAGMTTTTGILNGLTKIEAPSSILDLNTRYLPAIRDYLNAQDSTGKSNQERMDEASEQTSGGFRKISSGLQYINENTTVDYEAIDSGFDQIRQGTDILANGTDGKGGAFHYFSTGLTHLSRAMDDLDGSSSALSDSVAAMRDASAELTDALNKTEKLMDYLDQQEQLHFDTISPETDRAADALYDTVRGISDNLELLNGEVKSSSDKVLEDVRRINRQFTKMVNTLLDAVEDAENASVSSVVEDTSDEDVDAVLDGKVLLCTNKGEVSGDIDVGGIAGAMMVYNALDPESDEKTTLSSFFHKHYELKCILQNCVNSGAVTGKKDNVGAVCGNAMMGVISGCEGYGSARSEGGDCVGGIVGYADNIVRKCWSKSALSGEKYIGGVVGYGKADGSSLSVENCRTLVDITESTQYAGAILGAELGNLKDNLFVSDSLAGIDRVSERGKAEPVPYEQLLEEKGLPLEFRYFTLRFVANDAEISQRRFAFGDSFDESVFPEIPAVEGQFARWDRDDLSNLRFDTTVTAVYEPCITALGSAMTRSAARPVFFLEGIFDDHAELKAAPAMFDFDDGQDDFLHRLRSYRRTLLEQWQLTLPDDGAESHVIRYLPPEDAGRHLELYLREGTQWKRLSTDEAGTYLTFATGQRDLDLTVVSTATPWWVWTLVAGFLAVALLLALHVALLRKQKPAAEAQPAQTASEQTGHDGQAVQGAPTEEEAQAAAERRKTEKRHHRRRVIRRTLIAAVLVLGVAVGVTLLRAPGLTDSMGLYMLLRNYSERTDLDMDLSISTQIGEKTFRTDVTYFTTSCAGKRVACVLWQDIPLYYCDNILLLENGHAYQDVGILPDYTMLMRHAASLYRAVDVASSEENGVKTYHVTTQGEPARQILLTILPAAAQLDPGDGTLEIDLVLTDGEATSLTFHWNDEGGSAEALLRRAAVAHDHTLPQEVQSAIASGDFLHAEPIGDAANRLLLAWTEMVTRDPLGAEVELTANCGPLLVDETLDWQRTSRNGEELSCLTRRGTQLYYTGDAACTSAGLSVSRESDSFDSAPQLLHLAYEALLLGEASCTELSGGWRYNVTLDADAMAAFAAAIAPETKSMGLSLNEGTLRLELSGDKVYSLIIQCRGSVRVVRTDVSALLNAKLTFNENPFPEPSGRVLAALELDN